MHPAMAVWIWTTAMSRIMFAVPGEEVSDAPVARLHESLLSSPKINLGDYLQSEIITCPLPSELLDRLSDLYWTERECELAI